MDLKPIIDLFKYLVETKEKVFAIMLIFVGFVWFIMNQNNQALREDLASEKSEHKTEKANLQKKIDRLNDLALVDQNDCQAKIDELMVIHNQRYDELNAEFKRYVISTNREYKEISEVWKRDYQDLLRRVNKADQTTKNIQQKIKI